MEGRETFLLILLAVVDGVTGHDPRTHPNAPSDLSDRAQLEARTAAACLWRPLAICEPVARRSIRASWGSIRCSWANSANRILATGPVARHDEFQQRAARLCAISGLIRPRKTPGGESFEDQVAAGFGWVSRALGALSQLSSCLPHDPRCAVHRATDEPHNRKRPCAS